MKNIKVLISVLIVLILLFVSALPVFATPAPDFRGDANMDRDIDIKDATTIQKIVADRIEATKLQQVLADCNDDGTINVIDATLVQKVVGGIIKRNEMGGEDVHTYFTHGDYRASYDSGKAIVGEPVTFTFEVDTVAKPITYEFYVDDVLVGERSENNTCTYTFKISGSYKISVIAYNFYDLTYQYDDYNYTVVEPYTSDTPVISYFNTSYGDGYFWGGPRDCIVTVEAIKGEGPYEYKFVQYYERSHPDDKVIAYTRDFTSSNKVLLSDELLDDYYICNYDYEEYVEVTVRDAKGREATETYWIR